MDVFRWIICAVCVFFECVFVMLFDMFFTVDFLYVWLSHPLELTWCWCNWPVYQWYSFFRNFFRMMVISFLSVALCVPAIFFVDCCFCRCCCFSWQQFLCCFSSWKFLCCCCLYTSILSKCLCVAFFYAPLVLIDFARLLLKLDSIYFFTFIFSRFVCAYSVNM